jgi:hypothetical protein
MVQIKDRKQRELFDPWFLPSNVDNNSIRSGRGILWKKHLNALVHWGCLRKEYICDKGKGASTC